MLEGNAGSPPLHGIGGHCEGTKRHAVMHFREGDDGASLGDLAGQLQCRLHRVGTGRPAALHPIIQSARRQDAIAELPQEGELCRGMQIEGLEDSVILQIIDDGTFDAGIVVAVVDNTRTGKEFDVRTASWSKIVAPRARVKMPSKYGRTSQRRTPSPRNPAGLRGQLTYPNSHVLSPAAMQMGSPKNRALW